MAKTVSTVGDGPAQLLDAVVALAGGGASTMTFESVADEAVVRALVTVAVACLEELAVDLKDRYPDPHESLAMAYSAVADRLERDTKALDLTVNIKNDMREVIREIVREPTTRTVREIVRDRDGRPTHIVDEQV